MQHVAIDLGGMKSQICIRRADATIIRETLWDTRHLGRFLKDQEHSRVVVETCTEAFGVADEALAVGHEVRVCPRALCAAWESAVAARRQTNGMREF